MADERTQMEAERENLAIVNVDQPPRTAESQFYEGTIFGLPREWTAEIRPRKASSKYFGKVDQFFYEPRTQRQFRSLKSVKRHLGFDVGQTCHKRKSKATHQSKNLHGNDKFTSKGPDQSKNLQEDYKFVSKVAGQLKVKSGSSRKVAEEDKSEENHPHFDKITMRVRRQLMNGEENSWNMYIKAPYAVQARWMDMFLHPNNNNNQESNPPGME